MTQGSADVEFDEDGNRVVKKREIDPLPAVDHSKIDYVPFNKDFYTESEEITAMSPEEVPHHPPTTHWNLLVCGYPTTAPLGSSTHSSSTHRHPLFCVYFGSRQWESYSDLPVEDVTLRVLVAGLWLFASKDVASKDAHT